MHAAAAVGTPAVILWSEFISPEITGYSSMTNLRHAGKPCGNRLACASCRKSMEAITVDEVVRALEKLL
jgi:ADP-heptose:LPS heptosyltransferase